MFEKYAFTGSRRAYYGKCFAGSDFQINIHKDMIIAKILVQLLYSYVDAAGIFKVNVRLTLALAVLKKGMRETMFQHVEDTSWVRLEK
jgi:hypothetical protein